VDGRKQQMGKYKYFKIKTIKAWDGEDWDVYHEQKTPSGIKVYKGWPYSLTPKDGIGGMFSFILTTEIADFIKIHSIAASEEQLCLSNSIVAKFRRKLGIQNKFIYRDDQWLLEHQDELLHDSLQTLKTKYGLKRSQVYQHKKWLADLISIPARKQTRKKESDTLKEKWFIENKSKMINMSMNEIASEYNISIFIAKKVYNRIQEELGDLGFSEKFQQSKKDNLQWLMENQDVLLNQGKYVAELAVHFQKTNGQILRAKAKLREILKTPKVQEQNQAWLLSNQPLLQDKALKKEQLAQKLGITPKQVAGKKKQLKMLLNLPRHNDMVQVWRLDNQKVLLDLHLTIPEIAQILDRKENYIVKNRMILRNLLGITKQDQIKVWILEHQHDLETLNIEKLQEKYGIGRHVLKSYKKLLTELRQNKIE